LAVLWIIFVCKTPTSTPTSYYVINSLFIISMCILTVQPPPPNRKTPGHYAGRSPNFICSYGNIFFTKQERSEEIKRDLLM
jgi:hypothetical protein